MSYSLHRPPNGLAGYPRLIWPLVYLQLIALKAWVRRHYGPGVPYWYTVSRWGKVSLRHMPMDFAQSYAASGALRAAAFDFTLAITSPRLVLALMPEPCADLPVTSVEELAPSVHVLSVAARPDTS